MKNNDYALFDLFASQAPKEIPHWFDPEPLHESKPQEPSSDKYAKQHDPDGKNGLLRSLNSWKYDSYNFDSKTESIGRTFQDMMENYYTEKAIWENKNQIARYFQWRWYYAQQMLKERQNWI